MKIIFQPCSLYYFLLLAVSFTILLYHQKVIFNFESILINFFIPVIFLIEGLNRAIFFILHNFHNFVDNYF